jgi:hypothetical protein
MSIPETPSIDLIVSILSAIKKDIDEIYRRLEILEKAQKINN